MIGVAVGIPVAAALIGYFAGPPIVGIPLAKVMVKVMPPSDNPMGQTMTVIWGSRIIAGVGAYFVLRAVL